MTKATNDDFSVALLNEVIETKIYLIRGKKVMLARDLAYLYGVETKVLNQSVKRNIKRFPELFMFQLSKEEFGDWKSQFVTSNSDKMGLRTPPYAFTEHGVVMLSSVLNSDRAIQVNIQIVNVFVKLKELAQKQMDIKKIIQTLDRKFDKQNQENDSKFKIVFDTLKKLIAEPIKPSKEIGFKVPKKK